MVNGMDTNYGYDRHRATSYERLKRTDDKCPPPCSSTRYGLRFEDWLMSGSNVSLQIAFADFKITHREEYIACDVTCILGQLGGNIGLFLGGSILLGIDMLIEYTCLAVTSIEKRIF